MCKTGDLDNGAILQVAFYPGPRILAPRSQLYTSRLPGYRRHLEKNVYPDPRVATVKELKIILPFTAEQLHLTICLPITVEQRHLTICLPVTVKNNNLMIEQLHISMSFSVAVLQLHKTMILPVVAEQLQFFGYFPP